MASSPARPPTGAAPRDGSSSSTTSSPSSSSSTSSPPPASAPRPPASAAHVPTLELQDVVDLLSPHLPSPSPDPDAVVPLTADDAARVSAPGDLNDVILALATAHLAAPDARPHPDILALPPAFTALLLRDPEGCAARWRRRDPLVPTGPAHLHLLLPINHPPGMH